ncbi:MAG: hypothetical protein O2992_11485 [Gemmatimonadetes bacterium]|nr:hypothetical protein [Gemmatimonadota bacterium]
MTECVIGVEGGGTSTRAVVLDAQGTEVARAECPGAVVTAANPTDALKAVTQAARAAAERAGLDLPCAALWAGLAGAGRPDARVAMTDVLRSAGLAHTITVGTDVEAAFADAFGGGPGVMLIAGTGSIAWARDRTGVEYRVGGWGQHFGDEGGGHWIGVECLRCVAHGEDGRGPVTALRDVALAHACVAGPDQLIAWAGAATKSQIAGLAPLVVEAAAAGDPAARHVVARATEALRRHVSSVVHRSGPWAEPTQLALWGGLIWQGGPLRASLAQALTSLPVELLDRALDPPLGAARLALEMVRTRD